MRHRERREVNTINGRKIGFRALQRIAKWHLWLSPCICGSIPGSLLLFGGYLFPLQAPSFRVAQLKFTTKQCNWIKPGTLLSYWLWSAETRWAQNSIRVLPGTNSADLKWSEKFKKGQIKWQNWVSQGIKSCFKEQQNGRKERRKRQWQRRTCWWSSHLPFGELHLISSTYQMIFLLIAA